jgi:hypothetical protein
MTEHSSVGHPPSPLPRLIIIGVVILAASCVIAGMITGVFSRSRMSSRRTVSASHLHQIGKALQMYVEDPVNNNTPPASLAALYPKYVADQMLFLNPCVDHDRVDVSAVRGNSTQLVMIDYAYEPSLVASDMTSIVAYEKTPATGGRNILVKGGAVEFMIEEEFQKELARQRAALPAKPAVSPNPSAP